MKIQTKFVNFVDLDVLLAQVPLIALVVLQQLLQSTEQENAHVQLKHSIQLLQMELDIVQAAQTFATLVVTQ